jgi:hypothetical protein
MNGVQLKPAVLKRPSLTTKPLSTRLAAITARRMIPVAPGRYVSAQGKSAPDFTFARWSRRPDGHYELLPEETHMVRLTGSVIRMLGFNERADTIFRLARAGFVEVVQIAPKTTMLNLDSWWNHVRRCAEDPDFWNNTANIDEYRKAL